MPLAEPGSTPSPSALIRLGKALANVNPVVPTQPPPPLTLTRGTITGVNVTDAVGNTITTVQLAGSAKSVAADMVVGYNAKEGDDVEVLLSPPRVVVLGPTDVVTTPTPESIPYSYSGTLAASTSPPVTPRESLAVTGFSATLATAGTTTTTVELLINGNAVATLNLGSGVTYAYTTFEAVPVIGRAGHYAVSVTAAGTGAANLGGEIELN